MPVIGDYVISSTVIGEGTRSVVLYGLSVSTGTTVAVKVMGANSARALEGPLPTNSTPSSNTARLENSAVQHEIRILQRLAPMREHFAGFPVLLDVLPFGERTLLVFERIVGDTLLSICERAPIGLPEAKVATIFEQLAYAIFLCHSNGIAHRDIKLENVLFDGKNVSLIDFGLALENADRVLTTSQSGSMHYVAPEVVRGLPHDGRMSDMWSLGVTLFALLTGRFPFFASPSATNGISSRDKEAIRKRRMDSLFANITKGDFVLPVTVSELAADLVRKLICANPKTRMTIDEALAHPFIAKYSTLPKRLWTPPNLNSPLEQAPLSIEDAIIDSHNENLTSVTSDAQLPVTTAASSAAAAAAAAANVANAAAVVPKVHAF